MEEIGELIILFKKMNNFIDSIEYISDKKGYRPFITPIQIANSCDMISHGDTKYNLTTNSILTGSSKKKQIFHCDCDERVRKYFRELSIDTYEYFFYMSFGYNRCFKEEYPIIKCIEYDEDKDIVYGNNRCILYEIDKSKPKIYQFFDSPHYYNDTKLHLRHSKPIILISSNKLAEKINKQEAYTSDDFYDGKLRLIFEKINILMLILLDIFQTWKKCMTAPIVQLNLVTVFHAAK